MQTKPGLWDWSSSQGRGQRNNMPEALEVTYETRNRT
jgi:hypothetical protein